MRWQALSLDADDGPEASNAAARPDRSAAATTRPTSLWDAGRVLGDSTGRGDLMTSNRSDCFLKERGRLRVCCRRETFHASHVRQSRNENVPRLLAVPVAPTEDLAAMREEADQVVSLEDDESSGAIGLYYSDFRQIFDQGVIETLGRCAPVLAGLCACDVQGMAEVAACRSIRIKSHQRQPIRLDEACDRSRRVGGGDHRRHLVNAARNMALARSSP